MQGLGLIATAEGIEESGRCEALRSYGCDQGQGSLFSKAMSAREVPRLLAMPMPAGANGFTPSPATVA